MVSPPPVRIAAPAKINLYLHVTGRRDDGYHRLDSLIAFAGVHDALTFAAADHLTLQIKGPGASALRSERGTERGNLVLAAARGLARLAGIEAKAAIGLTKRLPVAAGMGGGSADAAAAIKGLCQLWTLNPAADDVKSLALELGADVPVCLVGKAAFVGGIGDEIAPAPALPACSIVLVNGGRKLATAAVFAARKGSFSGMGRFDYAPADAPELAAILATRGNDLCAPAIRLMPAIQPILNAIAATDKVLLARMTGSGATCFGLYGDPGAAAAAALKLGRANPTWWIKAASLESDITHMTKSR